MQTSVALISKICDTSAEIITYFSFDLNGIHYDSSQQKQLGNTSLVEFEFYKQFKHDTGTNFKTYCSKDLFSEVMTKPRNKVISFQESYRANNATVINFP